MAFWGSIRWRASLLTSGLVAAVLVVGIWYVVAQVKSDLLRAGGDRAETTATLLAAQTGQTTAVGTNRFLDLSKDPAIRDFAQQSTVAAKDAAVSRLQHFVTSGGGAAEEQIDVWDADARQVLASFSTISSTGGPDIRLPTVAPPFAPGVGPLLAVDDRLYTSLVAEIVANPDDRAQRRRTGYLVLRRFVKPTQPTLANNIVGNGATILIGNESGSVWTNLAHVVAPPSLDPLATGAFESRSPGGQRLIVATGKIAGTPWRLAVELSRDAIVAPAWKLLWRLVAAGVICLVLTTIVAAALSARVTRPLGELTDAAAGLARGDYSRRVVANRRDELGRLGDAFNLMAERVDEGRRTLEARAEDLTRSRESAERANRVKDQFLAVLSHELRTPLNAMLGWCHMLRDGSVPPEKTHHALQVVERNALAQLRLVEDLLDMSRIVAGKFAVDLQPVDATAVVRAAVESVEPVATSRRVQLVTDVPPSPLRVRADAGRLQQVVWNLLSNAIKFTPPGGRVSVSIARVGGSIEIVVVDTGEGISADALAAIFDRFQQESGSGTRRKAGLGLGLAIVREVVELHGGSVQAESAGVGCGSTFSVQVPALTAVDDTRPARATVEDPPAAGAASVRGLRILTVEDADDARELLTDFLTEHAAVVVAADSADAAWRSVDGERPDLIISDIEMPGEDGLQLMRRLRCHPDERWRSIPAIALTAHGAQEDRERSTAAGFQVHLVKPVDLTMLVATIASLINRTRESAPDVHSRAM